MLTATKIRYTGDVQEVRRLTGETIVLRIDRGNIDFEPGQYVRIGVDGDSEIRDYSIYSGNNFFYNTAGNEKKTKGVTRTCF